MNKNVLKFFWKSVLLNLLAGGIGMLPFLFLQGDNQIMWLILLLIIAALSLVIQLVVSIVYINRPVTKEKGQGMLLSVGLILLIGAAVCGSIGF